MVKRNLLALSLIFLMIFSGCKLFIKPDINTKPADLGKLLSGAELTLAKALGGYDVAMTTAMWLQQISGVGGQPQARYYYLYQPKEVNNLWSDLYAEVMKSCDSIIKLSDERNAKYYKGVAKILYALALGNTTDLFGDVPYSQAFRSDSPAYDPQQQVYQGIFKMLDEGIAILSASDPGDVELKGDIIYNWDVNKWIKAAYTLKARYLMHLTKVQQVDYQTVINYLNNGISSLDEDMKVVFYVNNTTPPIYEYLHKNTGIGNNITYQNILVDRNDPRITALGYNGFWARQDAYFPFVQYTEALFLKSEAYWRLGDSVDAKENLKLGVQASMKKYYIDDNQWYADYCSYVDSLPMDSLIHEIAVQDYIDLLYHPEAFVDWRRLDYPVLKPVVGDKLPRRFPYCQVELDRNSNTPRDVNIFTPVWWDIQDSTQTFVLR